MMQMINRKVNNLNLLGCYRLSTSINEILLDTISNANSYRIVSTIGYLHERPSLNFIVRKVSYKFRSLWAFFQINLFKQFTSIL